MFKYVKNSSQAIDILGGTYTVARLFAELDPRVVSNWRSRGLPADTWLVLGPRLSRRRCIFDPYQLFNMRKPHGGQDG